MPSQISEKEQKKDHQKLLKLLEAKKLFTNIRDFFFRSSASQERKRTNVMFCKVLHEFDSECIFVCYFRKL